MVTQTHLDTIEVHIRTHSDFDSMYNTCASPYQAKFQHFESWAYSPIPSSKKVGNCYLLEKEGSVFSKSLAPSKLTTLQ